MLKKRSANLFAEIPETFSQEISSTLLENNNFKIERIVSLGHATAGGEWLEESANEWVVLIQGGAKLLFEGEERPRYLQPGDYVFIPKHCRHRVEWTDQMQKSVWLAIHWE
ncbi:MAG: cupin domain-containing protein [Candidatus Omnitrophica bacterium]|nr:cupin domain-containing protein [Candidatus Omnitrophota bacterium]